MAKYKLLERSFIDGQLLEAGTVIGDGTQYPFSGEPGPHMEPLDSGARQAMKAAQDARKAESDPLLRNHPGDLTNPGFPRKPL